MSSIPSTRSSIEPAGQRTTVYKVGGSLLTLPDLSERLRDLLDRRQERRPLLIVGGGTVADVVRGWDRLHGLGEERAHRLALTSLRLNEALLAELLPRACIVNGRDEAADAWSDDRFPILSAENFLAREETSVAPGERLPHTWDVTSDSIAAWVVLRWPADELILLKSVSLPGDHDALSSGTGGLVDRHFRQMALRLPRIGWVNFRSADGVVQRWPSARRAEPDR